MFPAALAGPAAIAADHLAARGQTIAVAESSAGGLISAALLSMGGASAYYRGGFVIYTLEGTQANFGPLPEGTRSASEGFATHLAASAAAKVGADWGIGETGASGPSGNPYGDPAGHAWIAVTGPDGAVATQHVLTGEDDRVDNMTAFAEAALRLLAAQLT